MPEDGIGALPARLWKLAKYAYEQVSEGRQSYSYKDQGNVGIGMSFGTSKGRSGIGAVAYSFLGAAPGTYLRLSLPTMCGTS
jgi:hypothetical protein